MKGFDTAADTTKHIDALWDDGYRVAFRYLTRSKRDWRQLKPAEAKALSDKGFWIGVYWQHIMTDQKYLADMDRAKFNANEAIKRAKWLKIPKGSGIFYAIDFDVLAHSYGHLKNHFQIIKDIVEAAGYRLGCYGDDDVGSVLAGAGIVDPQMSIKTNARAWSRSDINANSWGAFQGLPFIFRPGFQIDPLTVTAQPRNMGLWNYHYKEEAPVPCAGLFGFLSRIFRSMSGGK